MFALSRFAFAMGTSEMRGMRTEHAFFGHKPGASGALSGTGLLAHNHEVGRQPLRRPRISLCRIFRRRITARRRLEAATSRAPAAARPRVATPDTSPPGTI